MFIVPFIYKVTKENNVQVHSIHLLTIAGKKLWEEDASFDVDRDILEPNDIYRKGDIQTIMKNVKLCEVDLERTNIQDFYQWKEIPLEDDTTFCWRTYFHLLGEKQECWLPVPHHETIGNHDVQTILQMIIRKEVI
jgi:hypothetical protein